MKAWKQWSLGVFLALGAGCSGFFAMDEDCLQGGCPSGEVCVSAPDGMSRCEKQNFLVDECRNDKACPAGQLCLANTPQGPRKCQSACRVGEDGCPENLVCAGRDNAKPGELGQCAPSDRPQCLVGDGSCNEGHVCDGQALHMPGRCREETLGTSCTTDAGCTFGTVCESLGGPSICRPGGRLPSGEVVAALKSFQLLQEGNALLPAQVNGGEIHPHPGFVREGENLPTTVYMVTQGPGSGEGSLWLDNAPACATMRPQCTANSCKWTCPLPPSWEGTGKARLATFRWVFGRAKVEHTWRYLVGPLPKPSLALVGNPSSVLAGDTMRMCATLSPLEVLLPSPPSSLHLFHLHLANMDVEKLLKKTLESTQEVPLTSEPATRESPSRMCRKFQLPLNAESGDVHIEASVDIANTAGHFMGTARPSHPTSLTRIECTQALTPALADAATQPLAMSGRFLLIGADGGTNTLERNNSLYLLDTARCILSGNLRTGATQGPMVVLGETGEVAMATRGTGGPSGRTAPRLLLVRVSPQLAFPRSASEDCVVGTATGTFSGARFSQGLALLSFPSHATGTWHLAAPANHDTNNQTQLMAYAPWGATSAERCKPSETVARPFLSPLVHKASGTVAGVHATNTTEWHWEAEAGWTRQTTYAGDGMANPSFMAVTGEDSVWAGDLYAGESAVAIDAGGRAYMLKFASSSLLQLWRYAANAKPRDPPEGSTSLPSGTFVPVGSPLLGEPLADSAAELYLVSTDGKVLAFEAESLRLLWTEQLRNADREPLKISPTAQPVLVANANGSGTLWVTGIRGEIRGIRVASQGLSRLAQWPKAFRDNCNTSSKQVTPSHMPGCF